MITASVHWSPIVILKVAIEGFDDCAMAILMETLAILMRLHLRSATYVAR